MILLERAEYSSGIFQFAEQAGERQEPGRQEKLRYFKNQTLPKI